MSKDDDLRKSVADDEERSFREVVASQIRDLMLAKGETVSSLARKSGIARPVLSRILNQRRTLLLAHAKELSRALGVGITDILPSVEDEQGKGSVELVGAHKDEILKEGGVVLPAGARNTKHVPAGMRALRMSPLPRLGPDKDAYQRPSDWLEKHQTYLSEEERAIATYAARHGIFSIRFSDAFWHEFIGVLRKHYLPPWEAVQVLKSWIPEALSGKTPAEAALTIAKLSPQMGYIEMKDDEPDRSGKK